METIEGSGDIVPEPNWPLLLADELEIQAAAEYWRVLTREMRERNLLSPVNAHALRRLVLAYVLHDRCAREVAENGAVTKPRRGNAKAIARISPHFTAMREAGSDAASLEAELGLSPRRRTSAGKVDKKVRVARASDAYLRPVSK